MTKQITTAVEALMDVGFTFEEAQRIRPYLPKQFKLEWMALPATNPDAWYCYMAAQHYDKFGSQRGTFKSHRPLSGDPLNLIEYRTDKDTLIFSEIEFLRYFGDAIFCDSKDGRRIGTIRNGGLVIKNGVFKARLKELERGGKSVFDRWNDKDVGVGEFVMPCYPRNATDMLEGVEALNQLCDGHNGYVDTLKLSQYILKVEEIWDTAAFIHYRGCILNNLLKRGTDSTATPNSEVIVSGQLALNKEGRISDVKIMPYSKYTPSTVVRQDTVQLTAPVVPPEIFTLYKEEDWCAALQRERVHTVKPANILFDCTVHPHQ